MVVRPEQREHPLPLRHPVVLAPGGREQPGEDDADARADDEPEPEPSPPVHRAHHATDLRSARLMRTISAAASGSPSRARRRTAAIRSASTSASAVRWTSSASNRGAGRAARPRRRGARRRRPVVEHPDGDLVGERSVEVERDLDDDGQSRSRSRRSEPMRGPSARSILARESRVLRVDGSPEPGVVARHPHRLPSRGGRSEDRLLSSRAEPGSRVARRLDEPEVLEVAHPLPRPVGRVVARSMRRLVRRQPGRRDDRGE